LSLFRSIQTTCAPTQPPSQWVCRYLSEGLKVAKVRNWPLTSIRCLHGIHTDKFSFTLSSQVWILYLPIILLHINLQPDYFPLPNSDKTDLTTNITTEMMGEDDYRNQGHSRTIIRNSMLIM